MNATALQCVVLVANASLRCACLVQPLRNFIPMWLRRFAHVAEWLRQSAHGSVQRTVMSTFTPVGIFSAYPQGLSPSSFD